MPNIRIVAEIGCNHNGDFELAKQLVRMAKDSGADAVKFQSFVAEDLVSKSAPKAEYQKKDGTNESQLEMIRKLSLSDNEYRSLNSYANQLGIECFSTAFDFKSINYLHKMGQNIWKIPSGEITNLPYLERIRDLNCSNKEIILSTGMSTIEEIHFATSILEQSRNTKFTILHCNTDYPTEDSDMNLLALHVLKEEFPLWNIGLSDHSEGIIAAITAVGMGIVFLEKHFTLDKSLPGPDHMASIIPSELKSLCIGVRRAERMLGTREKFVTESERKNRNIARKSIVARTDIKEGQVLSENNICCKRPGNGISPINWHKVIGKKADKDFVTDELITVTGIEWEEDKD